MYYHPALAAVALLLGACAASGGNPGGIKVEHLATQPGVGQWTADRHCAQFGTRALLVRKGPKQSNYGLIPQTNVSEFDCVQ
ncbi:MAG: hypothetical protein CFH40_01991 [Alphaproteobacteria bacterium MarineAlpha10_Bin3]|jgi:hypothetical protein|nr:MAG: hypothetical protein CFH40_01991 [Alphaproteobacteria bacterium MarineAlpha10_Bin3]PPR68581.1 MAG: hypothetical protein CFH09_01991 [Alphaproteobacteria bacterium MarineAlpha4_Bin1]